MTIGGERAARQGGPGDMGRVRCIHFVGIGGAGMSGIAEVLLNLGYTVTGSDRQPNASARHLADLGVVVHAGHDAGHLGDADAVVISSAVGEDNVEVAAARQRRLPVVPRAEMLAELMRFRFGIAVAGTHGKTTTTSLVASLLADAGLDPTFVIGGRLNSAASNARLGSGRYLVAEADESDASFLYLNPMIAVVTNIDADHLDTYEGDPERLREAFLEFLQHIPFYGLAILCADDPGVQSLLEQVPRPVCTYGLDDSADIRARSMRHDALCTTFELVLPEGEVFPVTLNLPGRHNVLNALAAVAVARELGVSSETIGSALGRFEGIGRRFQHQGELALPAGPVTVIDDYGHHPSEISAVFEALRAGWPGRRLLVAFQPHRYSRTRDLFDDFARVLADADGLIITEVYAAGEAAIAGADGRSLCRAIRARGQVDPVYVETIDELCDVLPGMARGDDVVVTLGAGSIGNAGPALREYYGEVAYE
jgi:UDP-N-acetylmuramate--alanine ligase